MLIQGYEHGTRKIWEVQMRLRARRRGMTLIEVLVAMVIMTVALIAGSTLIVASHTATIKADLYNVANAAAANALAGYEANGYAALPSTSPASSTIDTSGVTADKQLSMTMSTTIGAPAFNSLATNIKEIDITVSWNAGSSASADLAGQVKASTLISAP